MSLSVEQRLVYPPHWSEHGANLRRALDRGGNTHNEDDVLQMWWADQAQWWATPRSFVMTVLVQYPRRRRLRFELAGGDLDEILTVWQPAILAWGRLVGCDDAEFSARKGWRRVLQPGWRFVSEQCVLAL